MKNAMGSHKLSQAHFYDVMEAFQSGIYSRAETHFNEILGNLNQRNLIEKASEKWVRVERD